MSLQDLSQRSDSDIELQNLFLPIPSVSFTVNDVLNYNNLITSPIISVAPWLGINSQAKLWLHCECTYADGQSGVLKLAEAAPVSPAGESTAFTCELPLSDLSKLADKSTIKITLMVSVDGTLIRHSLHCAHYKLTFLRTQLAVNYSRWMTELIPSIDHLKVYELVLPSAHNAGVDKDGASWPADQWGACQDWSFSHQLRNGIRVLDLRLFYDRDHVGTHKEFIFKHGSFDANRYLNDCIQGVKEFATQNPMEIVILDFHEVEHSARQRIAQAIAMVLWDIALPPEATHLTLSQIRSQYPRRNVIIAWDYSDYDMKFWQKVHHAWSGNDQDSPTSLLFHIRNTMANPPFNKLWSMQAAGFDTLGPIRFGPELSFWNEFFNATESNRYRSPVKGNIINVDFFEGTGAVNQCIGATKGRANAARHSAPVGLVTSNITTQSIKLNWGRPADSETIVGYKLSANGTYILTTSNTEHVFTNLNDDTTYHFQVIAKFSSGDGAAAEITARTVAIPDTIRPTPPYALNFVFFADGVNFARLQWTASTDNVAVIGYQVYRNDLPFGGIVQQTFTLIDTVANTSYKVRALDAAGNFADSYSLTMPTDRIPPSKPTNLRASTITANSVSLEWNASSDNVAVTGYQIYRNDTPIDTVSSTSYTYRYLVEATHYVFKVRALDAAGNFADSDPLPVTTLDITAPSKPTNLRIESAMDKDFLFWDKSTDNVKVIGYEVYRNNTLLDTTSLTFFFPIDLTEPYWFRVRALDAAGNYADSDLLASKDVQPPSKPYNLRATTITGNSVALEWAASSDNVAVIGYKIYLNNTPITTVNNTRYTATGLSNYTTYTFKVRALDPAGNFADSDPLPVTTRPDTPESNGPTNLEFHRLSSQAGTIEWKPPIESGGVTGYQLSRDGRILRELSDTYFLFFDLTPGTTHFFEVRAIRNGQYSDPASISG